MIGKILAKIFGTQNDRTLAKYRRIINEINGLEPKLVAMDDQALAAQTDLLKKRLAQGVHLDDLLPEAFATVREASKRVMGMRHFDEQLMGGIALHSGCVAEMKTGEGKTLMATLALYLNALTGRPCHLVTVNDYLAKRDAQWMMPIYELLQIKAAFLQNSQTDQERREIYQADIVYGTNSEFGFDYLRDNMKFDLAEYVQREHYFAIVDEVDSILIDEARTPLIISGPSEKDVRLYKLANQAVLLLKAGTGEKFIEGIPSSGDYEVDEKARSVLLTESGVNKLEQALGIENLYAPEHSLMLHHLQQALRAQTLFKRDVEYLVTPDGKLYIVDEFTGRVLPGRRYSDGLHQALEAKENLRIERENQTMATITLQNYFRMYAKLGGMTGTASTDAMEFHKIYKLEVVVVPTHRPMVRVDEDDIVFLTKEDKYEAVVNDIINSHEKGQPVLVGTASVESSEHLSMLLSKKNIAHHVLNAKNHAKEAEIIKHAGERGQVTISTSMAGRGTDIRLGEGVAELGGLRVIATERYENRRVDDQLRGRSGRQGDPGSTKFYISLEDDLMRIFGGDRTKDIMQRYAGMQKGESIEHGLISKMVKNNQETLERSHFDSRKQLLEYDDVMNQQRTVVYALRRNVLTGGQDLQELIVEVIRDAIDQLAETICAKSRFSQEEYEHMARQVKLLTGLEEVDFMPQDKPIMDVAQLAAFVGEKVCLHYQEFRKTLPAEVVEQAERWSVLGIIDHAWKNHLQNIDHLKEGIGLRGYGQKQPLYEYKKESFQEFTQMIQQIRWDITFRVMRLKQMQLEAQEVEELQAQEALQHDQEASCCDHTQTGPTAPEEVAIVKNSQAIKDKDSRSVKPKVGEKKRAMRVKK